MTTNLRPVVESLWERLRGQLRSTMRTDDFETLIEPLVAECTGNTLTLVAESRRTARHLLVQHRETFLRGLHALGLDQRITLKIDAKERREGPAIPPARFASFPTFSSVLRGPANAPVLSALQAAVENPGHPDHAQIVVCGQPGSGKSLHLKAFVRELEAAEACRAIEAHREGRQYTPLSILYISVDEMVQDISRAGATKNWNPFNERYGAADVLVIDDLDRAEKLEGTTHQLERLLRGRVVQIVCSAKRPIAATGMSKIIRYSLDRALMESLGSLDRQMIFDLAVHRMSQSDRAISSEIAALIAKHISTPSRVEACCRRLLNRLRTMGPGEQLTVDRAWEFLRDLIQAEPQQVAVTDEELRDRVAEQLGIEVKVLTSKAQDGQTVTLRAMAGWLLANQSLVEISEVRASELVGRNRAMAHYKTKLVKLGLLDEAFRPVGKLLELLKVLEGRYERIERPSVQLQGSLPFLLRQDEGGDLLAVNRVSSPTTRLRRLLAEKQPERVISIGSIDFDPSEVREDPEPPRPRPVQLRPAPAPAAPAPAAPAPRVVDDKDRIITDPAERRAIRLAIEAELDNIGNGPQEG